jgi:hypothetical protein
MASLSSAGDTDVQAPRVIQPTPHGKARPNTPFDPPPNRFPILKERKLAVNRFLGVRRAFLHGHDHKADLSKRIHDAAWRLEEKQRSWTYQRQLDKLTTDIKLRDEEYLRRQNRPHPKPSEHFARATTGHREATSLPRDRQCSLYPRNHVRYLGS